MQKTLSEGTRFNVASIRLENTLTSSPRDLLIFPLSGHSEYSSSGPHFDFLKIELKCHQSGLVRSLLENWVEDTLFHSSPNIILESYYFHEAKKYGYDHLKAELLGLLDAHPYHAIVGLGDLVRPIPFSEEFAGDLDSLARAWKEWDARERLKGDSSEVLSEFTDNELGRDEFC